MSNNEIKNSLILNMTIDGCEAMVDKLVNSSVSMLSLYGASDDFLTVTLPLVLDEALRNAWIHGNKRDKQKKIIFSLEINADMLFLTIEDEGDGYSWQQREAVDNKAKSYDKGGRGLWLIQSYAQKVHFSDKGNKIVVELRIK